MMGFGGKALGRIIRFSWGHKGGAPMLGLVFLEEEEETGASLSLYHVRK